jgi:hypothetical protein
MALWLLMTIGGPWFGQSPDKVTGGAAADYENGDGRFALLLNWDID